MTKLEELMKMNADEILTELKNSVLSISIDQLDEYQQNLLIALNSAMKTDQKLLIEQCLFYNELLTKENELIKLGFDKFIYRDDLTLIIEALSEKNTKNIFFIELEKYPRTIPSDVVNKITKVKNIFDKCYVLYTDHTVKNAVKNEIKRKDPIVFGTFTNVDNKEATVNYMGERLYYIADWVDEYCDLTLDRLLQVAPEKVHSLYGDNDIDLNIIEKLKESEIGRELYKNISNKREEKKNKTIISKMFNLVKRLFDAK